MASLGSPTDAFQAPRESRGRMIEACPAGHLSAKLDNLSEASKPSRKPAMKSFLCYDFSCTRGCCIVPLNCSYSKLEKTRWARTLYSICIYTSIINHISISIWQFEPLSFPSQSPSEMTIGIYILKYAII